MKNFKFVFLGAFLILSAITSPSSLSAYGPAPLSERDIISEMNRERLSHGVGTLRENSLLASAAEERSRYLAGQGRIFHTSSPSGTPWPELVRVGYSYTFAGENLALVNDAVGGLMAKWMTSPTHRENILHGIYEDVGVGVTTGYYGSTPVSYVVVYFGKQSSSTHAQSASAVTKSKVASNNTTQAGGVTVGQTILTKPSVVLGKFDTSPLAHSSKAETFGEAERIKLMKELISLLGSYVSLLGSRQGLI